MWWVFINGFSYKWLVLCDRLLLQSAVMSHPSSHTLHGWSDEQQSYTRWVAAFAGGRGGAAAGALLLPRTKGARSGGPHSSGFCPDGKNTDACQPALAGAWTSPKKVRVVEVAGGPPGRTDGRTGGRAGGPADGRRGIGGHMAAGGGPGA
eukprot:gene12128-biopygen1883